MDFINIENEKNEVVGKITYTIFDESSIPDWLTEDETVDRLIEKLDKGNLLFPAITLDNISVKKEFRNLGYGNTGMNEFCNQFYNYATIWLQANINDRDMNKFDLVSWYEGYGFKVVGETGEGNPIMLLQQ